MNGQMIVIENVTAWRDIFAAMELQDEYHFKLMEYDAENQRVIFHL